MQGVKHLPALLVNVEEALLRVGLAIEPSPVAIFTPHGEQLVDVRQLWPNIPLVVGCGEPFDASAGFIPRAIAMFDRQFDGCGRRALIHNGWLAEETAIVPPIAAASPSEAAEETGAPPPTNRSSTPSLARPPSPPPSVEPVTKQLTRKQLLRLERIREAQQRIRMRASAQVAAHGGDASALASAAMREQMRIALKQPWLMRSASSFALERYVDGAAPIEVKTSAGSGSRTAPGLSSRASSTVHATSSAT